VNFIHLAGISSCTTADRFIGFLECCPVLGAKFPWEIDPLRVSSFLTSA